MNGLSERAMITGNWDLQPNLNVHDDLSFILPTSNLESVMPIVAEEMCKHRFDFINVPLLVEASTGPNWFQLKEKAVYRSDEIYQLRNPFK
jgi:DNA polymerase I-like protein with 3'-5' exonuclease and polymerase domains